jgi:hypothetical protein
MLYNLMPFVLSLYDSVMYVIGENIWFQSWFYWSLFCLTVKLFCLNFVYIICCFCVLHIYHFFIYSYIFNVWWLSTITQNKWRFRPLGYVYLTWLGLGLWCLMSLSTVIQLYCDWGNQSTRRKPQSLTNIIT